MTIPPFNWLQVLLPLSRWHPAQDLECGSSRCKCRCEPLGAAAFASNDLMMDVVQGLVPLISYLLATANFDAGTDHQLQHALEVLERAQAGFDRWGSDYVHT
jgi:hypothetical protein